MKGGWPSMQIIISSYASSVHPPPISFRILHSILINPLSQALARTDPTPHAILDLIIAKTWSINPLALVLARALTPGH
jgi:hypothetical protein